jgi:AsmA protein
VNVNAMNINPFKPLIENKLTAMLGRQVKLGDLSASPLSSTVDAQNLTIADDPQFSAEPFITAAVIHIGVQMRPLLLQRQILIESLEIEAAQIHLVRAANGAWNLSTLGGAATQTQPQNEPAIPAFTIDSFRIKNGHATLENLAPARTPILIDQIDLAVSNFGFAKEFSFTLSALASGQATLNINGKAGPINSRDPAKTNFDTQLALHHFDPIATGFVNKGAGISLLADIDAHAVSDGAAASSNGTLQIQNLQLRPDATPAAKPIGITYKVTHNLSDNTGQLLDAAFQTGTVSAHLNGTYAIHPDNIAVDLKLAGDNLPINELQSLLPAVGVKPPNVPQSGTLTTHMTIVGPLQALVINGAVEFANIRLPGFKLGSQQKN